MTAVAATIPFHSNNPFEKKQSDPSDWTPSDRDRLIFQWVKFDGHTQSWVAAQLDINQATVSRVIDRFERWIAHAQPGQNGQLTHAERLRAQRWLTYERNERFIAAAQRIAAELEGSIDASRSTVTRPVSNPSQETEWRTVHFTIDRTAMAARFIRLGFRINMEQLALIEKAELEPLAPLTDSDIEPREAMELAEPGRSAPAAEETEDPSEGKADRATSAEPHCSTEQSATMAAAADSSATLPLHAEHSPHQPEASARDAGASFHQPEASARNISTQLSDENSQPETWNSELETLTPHTVHNCIITQVVVSPDQPCTCAVEPAQIDAPKISRDACMAALHAGP